MAKILGEEQTTVHEVSLTFDSLSIYSEGSVGWVNPSTSVLSHIQHQMSHDLYTVIMVLGAPLIPIRAHSPFL